MATHPRKPKSQSEILSGKEKSLNRALQVRRDTDNVRDFTLRLEDIDTAIIYYLENIVLANIEHNDDSFKIPIIYGSPERWKSVREDGYYKDQAGKIQIPLIMFRRTGIAKNRELSSKIDSENPQLYLSLVRNWNKKNQYTKFSALNNVTPEREYYNIIMPEWVTITYEFIIWTDYVDQMNSIIESINYSEGSYWGDPNKFKFRTRIDDYTNTVDLIEDSDRTIKTTFQLTLNGYLVSNAINKEIANFTPKMIGNKVLKFNAEIEGNATDTFYVANKPTNKRVEISTPELGRSINESSMDANLFEYLMTNVTINSDSIIGNDVAVFDSASILDPPAPYTFPISKENFTIFINGQVISNALVMSVGEVGTEVRVQFDTASMGYDLVSTDVVTAFGKFTPPSDGSI